MEKRIIENEKEAFQVPEGYFEGFEEKLMARIARQEEPERKPAHRQLWINRISIAAGIIGVLMLVTTAIINTQNEIGEKTQQIITANADENDAYYDEINAELSNEEIEDALAQIEFNE